MVCRLVEKQHVRARKHHARQHAAHALAARDDLGLLLTLLARKEHAPQKAAHERLVRIARILAQPVDEVQVDVIEKFVVVLRQVRLRRRHAPFERARIRLHIAHEDLEERRLAHGIRADEGDLVPFLEREAHVIQHLLAVDRLRQAADLQ